MAVLDFYETFTYLCYELKNFTPKIVKIQLCSIFDNSVFDQNHDFWRENSN